MVIEMTYLNQNQCCNLDLGRKIMIDEILSLISTKDIYSIKKKIDFYLAHYMSIRKTQNDDIRYEEKIKFLNNLNQLLDHEIKIRLLHN
jgi:hypothetical protein